MAFGDVIFFFKLEHTSNFLVGLLQKIIISLSIIPLATVLATVEYTRLFLNFIIYKSFYQPKGSYVALVLH